MPPTIRTPLVAALTTLAALLCAPEPATARTPPRPPRHAWPLAPPHPVLKAFRPPPTPFRAGHRGVDLGAAEGTVVVASADATVHFAGHVGRRRLVSLTHEGDLRTTYEPLTPLVERGQRITKGTPIGTLDPGHEGCRTPCLHWAAYRPTPRHEYLDPLTLLTRPRIRLLPLEEEPTTSTPQSRETRPRHTTPGLKSNSRTDE